MRGWDGWRDLGHMLCGCTLLLLLIVPKLLGGWSFAGDDIPLFTLPQFQLISELWRGGELPAWNPYLGIGLPLLGDSSLPLFYPLNILHFLFTPTRVLDLFLLLHLMLSLAGAYALARALELERMAALLTGLVFAVGGAALSQTATPMYCFGAAWMPWGVLFFLHSFRPHGGAARLVLAALPFVLTFLSGAVELCALTGVLAFAFGLFKEQRLAPVVARLTLVALLSMALCALVLLPMLRLMPETLRAQGMPLSWTGRWSLAPLELFGLLVPRLFDKDALPLDWVTVHAPRPWYPSLYMGALPLIFALMALRDLFEDGRVRLMVFVCVLLLPFAFGLHTPIYRVLHELLPALRGMRFPAKLFLPVMLCLSLLAGIGFDRWTRAERGLDSDRFERLLIALAALAGALMVAGSFFTAPALSSRAALPFGVCAAALLWLRQRRRFQHRPALFLGGFIVLVMIELGLASQHILRFIPNALLERRPELVRLVQTEESRLGHPIRLGQLDGARASAVLIPGFKLPRETLHDYAQRAIAFPNAGMPYRIRTAYPFSPLRSLRWHRLWERCMERELDVFARYPLRGITHVLASAGDPELARCIERARFGPWRLAELPNALPWAAVYGSTLAVPDREAAIEARVDGSLESTIVEDPGKPGLNGRRIVGSVKLVAGERDRLSFDIAAEKPGLAVLREAYAAGWTAKLDGAPVPILAVDVLFRGVRVPAGKHELVMEYSCPGWRSGLIISLVALLISVATLVQGIYDHRVSALLQSSHPSGT